MLSGMVGRPYNLYCFGADLKPCSTAQLLSGMGLVLFGAVNSRTKVWRRKNLSQNIAPS